MCRFMSVCVSIRIHVPLSACGHVPLSIWVRMCSKYMHVYIHVDKGMCPQMCVCIMRVRMCKCIYVFEHISAYKKLHTYESIHCNEMFCFILHNVSSCHCFIPISDSIAATLHLFHQFHLGLHCRIIFVDF